MQLGLFPGSTVFFFAASKFIASHMAFQRLPHICDQLVTFAVTIFRLSHITAMASSHLNQLFVWNISRLGALFHMFQPNPFAFKGLFAQDAFVPAAFRLKGIETIVGMSLCL